MKVKKRKPYFFIKSVEKATKILVLLAKNGELSVSEIGKRMGMHRSATHRFLATLRELGFLEQSENSCYRLSFRLFELGMNVADSLGIREIVHSFLIELSSMHEETANLGILDGTDIIYVDKVESPHLLRMDLAIGRRVPSYCTALGKVILANRTGIEVQKLFRDVRFKHRTPRTIENMRSLLSTLPEIRAQGYAIDDEELSLGIRCVACPIFDYKKECIAAISLAGPTVRMAKEKIKQIRTDLLSASKAISVRLGFRK